jgi:hypothetical protein
VALLMGYHNNQGGLNDYNNLAPEDCEEIIQHSASTPTTSGISIPNQYIGFGRLNAGKALRLIEFPYKTLYHFGTNTITPYTFTKSVYSNSDTIRLTEKYQNMANTWFTRGKYVVKTFEINATVNHGINSSTDSMMYYWARPSSSYVFPLFNSISKLLQPREKVLITNMNSTFASLKGYVYKVWDSLGNYKGWIPCDTSFAALYSGSNAKNTLMEYSIITKNIGLSVKENSMETRLINLFPNPSSNAQTIEIVTQKGCSCTIELFDIMGRLIKNVYNGRLDNGKNEIHCDVTKLPNSMYIYYIKTDSNVACKKFIKE